MSDIATLKANTDIVDVIGRRVSLRQKGAEHVGKCPFHDDHRASLQVNIKKQVFACFACGKSGDVIDFLMEMGATFQEAKSELSGELLNQHTPTVTKRDRAKPVTWSYTTPSALPGQIAHFRHGAPARSWPYRGPGGELLGLICRFDTPDGKEVLPYTYRTDGTRKEWRWMGFPKPRPLYGLDRLAANPSATVLLVEGEKTADAAQALLPHVVAMCWQGGAKAITATDWEPLRGRKVVLWPDNDQPGNEAMLEIAAILRGFDVPLLKWIRNSSEFPEKWDVADATDWTKEQALAYVRANMVDVPEPEPEPVPPTTEPTEPTEPEPMPEYQPFEFEYTPPPDDFSEPTRAQGDAPFKVLGFCKMDGRTQYAFFSQINSQVHLFGPTALASAANYLLLAPLDYWQTFFPKGKGGKSSFHVEAAMNSLIGDAHNKGIYNPTNTRGRGAWLDQGRVVIHVGDGLVVDGKRVALHDIESSYMYEANIALSYPTENPLPVKDANRLMEVVSLINWERPINAHLLAGWCVIAPICGALTWRPHIWITGSAGTGKSWVFNSIVRRLLGRNVLAVQSETSEAGIRQTLGNDAMPIVFDEAEGEDRRARERMESVLALMRGSSSEDGGMLLKGSAGGRAQAYQIRSCFAFASIGVQITQQSDKGRVTILGLVRPTDEVRTERWKKLKELHREILTQEFVARLQARTVALLPVIMENAQTFADAAAYELGDQRTGDQLGALLAGAYSLHSNSKITFDAALEFIRTKDWSEEKTLDTSRDEIALLARLTDHILRVDGPNVDRTIGELIAIAAHKTPLPDPYVTADTAAAKLLRHGIKVEKDHFVISQSNTNLIKIFENTAWVKSIGRTLSRIEGAQQLASARFAPGQTTRAVKIPLKVVTE